MISENQKKLLKECYNLASEELGPELAGEYVRVRRKKLEDIPAAKDPLPDGHVAVDLPEAEEEYLLALQYVGPSMSLESCREAARHVGTALSLAPDDFRYQSLFQILQEGSQ